MDLPSASRRVLAAHTCTQLPAGPCAAYAQALWFPSPLPPITQRLRLCGAVITTSDDDLSQHEFEEMEIVYWL